MLVLSSYRLSNANNARISEVVESLGGRFLPTGFDDTVEEVIDRIEGNIGDATIFLGGRLTNEQWEKRRNLQWIHVPWAGVNSLLATEGIRESDVLLTNSSGIMADSVADQVMAYLIMLNRSLVKQIRWQQKREWNRYPTVEHPDRRILRGMTLGILGYGAIGRAIAARAIGFGMRSVVVKRNIVRSEPTIDRLYSTEQLPSFLPECDFIVVALPLTPETKGLLGEEEFRQMKPTAYLVNIARGDIIREEELIQALQQGEIAGAALDVFEEEPLPESSVLWEMENVIVTPHSSGGFVGFGDAAVELFLDNLIRYTRKAPMQNVVHRELGY